MNKSVYWSAGQIFSNDEPTVKNLDDPYMRLRAGIIQRAVADLTKALITNNKGQIRKLEKWFLSDWGQAISGNNGKFIIDRVYNGLKQELTHNATFY